MALADGTTLAVVTGIATVTAAVVAASYNRFSSKLGRQTSIEANLLEQVKAQALQTQDCNKRLDAEHNDRIAGEQKCREEYLQMQKELWSEIRELKEKKS